MSFYFGFITFVKFSDLFRGLYVPVHTRIVHNTFSQLHMYSYIIYNVIFGTAVNII